MWMPLISKTAVPAAGLPQTGHNNSSGASAAKPFAAALAKESQVAGVSDVDVKSFFDSNPSKAQVAEQAIRLGLNEEQIVHAMQIGGYGDCNSTTLKSDIDRYVSDLGNGCAWGTNGVLTSSKAGPQGVATAGDSAMPAADEIRAFYAGKPTDQQVTNKAKSLGLTPAQMVQFQVTGMGMNMPQVSAHVTETMFVDAASRLGTDIGGGVRGGWTSYFSPALGRAVTKTEIQDFFSKNPSQSDIFQKAADLGLGVGAVNNMMVGLGLPNGADAAKAMRHEMEVSLFTGADGFSLNLAGTIVPGGGKHFVWTADHSSGSWEANSDVGSNVVASA